MAKRRKKLAPSAHEIAGRGKLFETVYADSGGCYGGEIEARTIAGAERLALQRGLNERVIGMGADAKPRTQGIAELVLKPRRKPKDLLDALHEACFLGFVGLQSGTLTARELLGDGGLVHELVHKMSGHTTPDLDARIAKMAREFECRVPGWPAPPVSKRKVREALNKGR